MINARLKNAIKKQYGTAANLCRTWPGLRELKGKESIISALIHLKASPVNQKGNFFPLCLILSEALGILPDKLFPRKLYATPFQLEITTVHSLSPRTIRELQKLQAMQDEPEDMVDRNLLRDRVKSVLKTLSYRERKIIELRFGLPDGYEYTLSEVGHIFELTDQRVRQIESKALRKLQQPERSERFVEFLP